MSAAPGRINPSIPDPYRAFVTPVASGAARPGRLAGLRFAAKDCLDLAGRSPGCGLPPGPAGAPPLADAAILRLLRDAGATLVGMTQMTPLAYEPSGANAALGRPLNPLDDTMICGGSSSGSAVAVAAGAVDFAVGTDTAGSLRIPAHCCGIAAWKPSPGLVPTEGVMPLAPSLDAVGFLAARPADLARLARLIAPASPTPPLRRIAIAADVVARAAPAEAAITALRRTALSAGFHCRDTHALPLLDACDAPVLTLLQGEAYAAHAPRIAAGMPDPVLATRLAKGATLPAVALATARETLDDLRHGALDVVFGADEILLLPVMPIATPRVALCEPDSPDFSPRTLYALSAFTRFANGLGLPVVSFPAGHDANGMPVGLQLVARHGRDAALVEAAAALAETPGFSTSSSSPLRDLP